ncbi:MAG: BrnT family toxin [Bryobacterales bacterium]|nr:BrnT family toxin [Bryobacterales bacterium]
MVRFEWDETKNRSNFRKHRIDFETAQLIFDDPGCVTFVERTIDGEPRWHAIGFAEGVILLVVVHTYSESSPGEIIRIISARQATPHERKLYEAAHS